MDIEYEVRILEIDKDIFIKKLEKLKAEKVGDFFQRRYVYDFNPVVKGKWIRLRTNGDESTLTIKNIGTEYFSDYVLEGFLSDIRCAYP